MAADRDWDRLAEFTRERRTELGMTQEDVRAAGGPSTATMRLIEGALQPGYQPATLRDLEKVFQWERGSVARILAGGDPVAPAASVTPLREPPWADVPPAAPPAPPGFVTDEIKEEARPFADKIWRRLWEIAGAPDPSGDGQPRDPGGSAMFGEGTQDQWAWDFAAGHTPLGKTWAVAVLRSRREAAGEQGAGTGLARVHP